MQKKDIRKEILSARKQLPVSLQEQASAVICEKILGTETYRKATDVLCYMDIRGEVHTERVLTDALQKKKRVWLPKIDGSTMRFFRVHCIDELSPGCMGIPEPDGSTEEFLSEEALVIVPGVAFDESRNRLGYGGGFYDRFLAERPKVKKWAVCYEMQIVEALPCELQDIRMDHIITERRFL